MLLLLLLVLGSRHQLLVPRAAQGHKVGIEQRQGALTHLTELGKRRRCTKQSLGRRSPCTAQRTSASNQKYRQHWIRLWVGSCAKLRVVYAGNTANNIRSGEPGPLYTNLYTLYSTIYTLHSIHYTTVYAMQTKLYIRVSKAVIKAITPPLKNKKKQKKIHLI